MRHAKCVACLTAVMLLYVFNFPSHAADFIAYVVTFDPPASLYRVRRPDEPARPGQEDAYLSRPLFEGDEVRVSPPGELTIHFVHGGSRVLTAQDPQPYTVTYDRAAGDANEAYEGVERLISAVAHNLAPWTRETAARPPIGARVRGDDEGPLDVALLDHQRLQLVEGRRDLSLTWTGGEPPFRVRLGRPGSPPTLDVGGLTQRTLPSRPVTLSTGPARLTVEDSSGQMVEKEIMVVSRRLLPQPPADAELSSVPPDDRKVVHATWLASIDDGIWALESYLMASEAATGSEPARALAAMLAAGDLPALQ